MANRFGDTDIDGTLNVSQVLTVNGTDVIEELAAVQTTCDSVLSELSDINAQLEAL